DRFLDELLDERLAPGVEHGRSESASKTADPRKTNPIDLMTFTVEHDHPRFLYHFPHQFRSPRFTVVIAAYGQYRNLNAGTKVLCKHFGLFHEAVVCQVATEQEHVGLVRRLCKHLPQRTRCVSSVMGVTHHCQTKPITFRHCILLRNSLIIRDLLASAAVFVARSRSEPVQSTPILQQP